jgi:hypothetical protein
MSDEQTKPKIGIVEPDIHDDPFDLKKLRISQNFLEATPVKKLTTTVPVRKPGPQDFFRVHPAPNYRELMAFLELKDDREIYVVDLNAVPDLQSECFIATLFTAITRTGVLFMWAVRVPAADGRTNSWHLSAAAAAEQARTQWIRMRANMSLRAYEIFLAESKIPEPEWPDLTFEEIYRIAFKDRLINRLDHPVIKRLRG